MIQAKGAYRYHLQGEAKTESRVLSQNLEDRKDVAVGRGDI